ncbi:MAG: M14 family zinc carboxypeptidase, partial [Chthoniobacterales bacterium]
MKSLRTCAFLIGLSVIGITGGRAASSPAPHTFSPAASQPILPPLALWDGKSRELIAPKDDPWITPAEKTDFRFTPSYDETVAWLRKLVAAAPQQLKMISLGKSPESRDIWMVVAARDNESTPEALRKNGKPTVLAQAGIHSGEIDGKDAGLMLLRDMTARDKRRDLLEQANFLFVPI